VDKIKEIFQENVEKFVTIQGELIDFQSQKTRNSSFLIRALVYDQTSTIMVSYFTDQIPSIEEGDYVEVKGRVQFDPYNRGELTLKPTPDNIRIIEAPKEKELDDKYPEPRVSLQNHTFMTGKQGAAPVEDFVKKAKELGHDSIAITDVGVAMAFPDFKKAADEHNIKPIYGMTANMIQETVMVYDNEPRELTDDIVVFDVEATGLSSTRDDIIEIGAAKVVDGKIVDVFQRFVKPEKKINSFIQELTGITNEMVEEKGIDPKQALEEFNEFIGDAMMAAHNAEFDYHMIEQMHKRVGLSYKRRPMIDTLKTSRKLNKDISRHNLGAVARYFGVDLKNAHRADDDSKATAEVWIHMVNKLSDEGIHTTEELQEYEREMDYQCEFPKQITLWAKNQTGLKNLYRIISKSSTNYLSRLGSPTNENEPVVPKELIQKNREGLIVGSGGHNGFLFEYALEKPRYMIEEEMDFYDVIQIEPDDVAEHLSNEEGAQTDDHQNVIEAWELVHRIAQEKRKFIVATDGANYTDPKDRIIHNIIVYSEFPPSYAHDRRRGRREAPLGRAHFRTTGEMFESFPYLKEDEKYEYIVKNPNLLSSRVEEVNPTPIDKEGNPILYTPNIDNIAQKFSELAFSNARKTYGDPLPSYVQERLEREVDAINENNFAVIYMISRDLVNDSLDNGYLVGSRGSVGSSLAATMTEITEVNPLNPHYVCDSCSWSVFFEPSNDLQSGFDLPEKFGDLLDEEVYSEEVIDSTLKSFADNFETTKDLVRKSMEQHNGACPMCKEHSLRKDGQNIPFETFLGFDGDKVPDIDLNFSGIYQAKSHEFVQKMFGKDKVFRAGTIQTVAERTAFAYVSNYVDNNDIRTSRAEVQRLAKKIEGSRTGTGQHPGGMFVVPDDMDMEDICPYNFPANNKEAAFMTSHFGYEHIEENILKLDILGHEAPTLLRFLEDYTGISPMKVPESAPETLSLFTEPKNVLGVDPKDYDSKTGTLGLPEMGTTLVQDVIEETKPKSFGDLVTLSGLTHGTGVFQGNAQELIKDGTATINEVIGTRDDIMGYLISMGMDESLSFTIMESVRRGNGLKPEWKETMKKHDVPDWYIWSCKQIEYMFPKAHAAAYVLDATRVGYYKVHYPLEFTAAIMSARYNQEDIYLFMGDVEQSFREKETLEQEIADLFSQNERNAAGLKDRSLTALKTIIEAKLRGVKFGNIRLYESHATRYLIDKEKNELIPPFSSVPNVGPTTAQALYEEKKKGVFRGLSDLQARTGLSRTGVEHLRGMCCLTEVEDEHPSLF